MTVSLRKLKKSGKTGNPVASAPASTSSPSFSCVRTSVCIRELLHSHWHPRSQAECPRKLKEWTIRLQGVHQRLVIHHIQVVSSTSLVISSFSPQATLSAPVTVEFAASNRTNKSLAPPPLNCFWIPKVSRLTLPNKFTRPKVPRHPYLFAKSKVSHRRATSALDGTLLLDRRMFEGLSGYYQGDFAPS